MAGTSGLKGTLMIGRWKWFKTSLVQWILGAAIPSLTTGSYSVKSCFDLLEGGRQHQVPIKML